MAWNVAEKNTYGHTRSGMPFRALTVTLVQKYLSVTEVADRAGLSPNSIKQYSQHPGRLPEPDAMIGRVRGWLPETIDAWLAKRAAR